MQTYPWWWLGRPSKENVEDYKHNHVLRTVIYDDKLSAQTNFATGEVVENNFEISLSELEQYNINYSTNTAELGNGNAVKFKVYIRFLLVEKSPS